MMKKIYRLIFRSDSPQHVERNCTLPSRRCLEYGDATLRASRGALKYDIWVTQYNEVVLSEQVANILRSSSLTGFVLGLPVKTYVNGKFADCRNVLAPRACVGLAAESSRLRIVKYSRGIFAFRFQSDPPWGKDFSAYASVPDVFQIWPFYNTIFVTENFLRVISHQDLNGFHFLPFEESSTKPKGMWDQEYYGSLNLGEPFEWLSNEERRKLWKEIVTRADPILALPEEMPGAWYQVPSSESREMRAMKKSRVAPVKTDAKIEWSKRESQFKSIPRYIKKEALDYLKLEYAGGDIDDWKNTDLAWDGDARLGNRIMRRWRAKMLYPLNVWVVYEVEGENGRLFLTEL